MNEPQKIFTRVLRKLWREADPASESPHFCDALGHDTTHKKLATKAGACWAHASATARCDVSPGPIEGGVFRRAVDNLIRPVACSLKLGHRVEVVLEKIVR